MHIFRSFIVICALSGAMGLAGCNEDNKKDASAKNEAAIERLSAQKYNAYISAANANGKSFAEGADGYEKYIVPDLASKKPLDSFWVTKDSDIDYVKKKLDTALAISAPLPELDPAAKDYAEALGKLSPLSHELDNYADSKGYLSDGGQKAREKADAYLAALRDVVKTEAAYDAAISKQDMLNIKLAFEKEKQDTLSYYKAGILYHSKLSMQIAEEFFANPDNAKVRAAFKASLDQVNDMVNARNEKLREAKITTCSSIASSTNYFIAAGRTALNNAEKGAYKQKASSAATVSMLPINRDIESLSRTFNNIISTFNQGSC